MGAQASNPVKTTETTISIVRALDECGVVGVTALADTLGLSKGTVHNHLSTLAAHDYVVKVDGGYRLGMRYFQLGQRVRDRVAVPSSVANQYLRELATETGEIANLMVEDAGVGFYVDIERGENAIALDTTVGTSQHLHTCALGKAILAHLPETRLAEILDRRGLPERTRNTVTDEGALREELREIRRRGVAYDTEERAEHVRCVAAPIRSDRQEVLGAVSVTGPTSRMKDDRLESEIIEEVKHAATVIGINATYA
jgi:DNA-binding IclR family transcriptional regulator